MMDGWIEREEREERICHPQQFCFLSFMHKYTWRDSNFNTPAKGSRLACHLQSTPSCKMPPFSIQTRDGTVGAKPVTQLWAIEKIAHLHLLCLFVFSRFAQSAISGREGTGAAELPLCILSLANDHEESNRQFAKHGWRLAEPGKENVIFSPQL